MKIFEELTKAEKDDLRRAFVRSCFDPSKFPADDIEAAVEEQYREVAEEDIRREYEEEMEKSEMSSNWT